MDFPGLVLRIRPGKSDREREILPTVTLAQLFCVFFPGSTLHLSAQRNILGPSSVCSQRQLGCGRLP